LLRVRENDLTLVLAHTPIAYSGQGSTIGYLLAVKPEKTENLLKIAM